MTQSTETPRFPLARRAFLGAALGGALAIAGGVYYHRTRKGRARADPAAFGAHAWLALEGRTVTLSLPVVEIGQGAASSLAQAVAEELDVDWASVRVQALPVDPAYYGRAGYITAGSYSIRNHFMPVRRMAAAARTVLVQAAAERWGVPVDDCRTTAGSVLGPRPDQRLDYGALTSAAAALPAPTDPALVPRERWRHIGKPHRRHDLQGIVTGQARYGIDVHLPGMLHAAMCTAPADGMRVAQMDEAAARAVRGVQDVLPLDDSVAVLASGWHAAEKGLRALRVQWAPTAANGERHASVLEGLRAEGPRQGPAAADAASAADTGGATSFDYSVPMLTQMAMEPVNATVQARGDEVEIRVSTQDPHGVRMRVARHFDLAPASVHVHAEACGGGFGRRLQADYVIAAVAVARRAGGKAVKVMWPRDQDTAASHVRPAARLRARLLSRPGVSAVDHARFELSVLGRKAPLAGLEETSYANLSLELQPTPVPSSLRTGPWRSVAYSQNLFFLEAFANDVARVRGEDPLALRMRWLGRNRASRRARRVLEAVATAADWRQAGNLGQAHRRGQGLALAECFGAAIAVVVQAHLPAPGALKVERIIAAADAGLVLNPDAVRAQVTGALLMALGAAASEEMTVDDAGLSPMNFDSYPLLRMPEAPPVSVLLVGTEADTPGGVGEIGVPPLAPALLDAIVHAGGPGIRALPLRRHGLMLV